MARGDLLFYRSRGSWYENLIVAATSKGNPGANFVHVEIDLGDGSSLSAESNGIVQKRVHVIDYPHIERVSLASRISSPTALDMALAWADKQVGDTYGWVDIFDQFLRLLKLPFYIGRLRSLDCSDLTACFAALATQDLNLLTLVLDQRQEISPNDLARYYGLTK